MRNSDFNRYELCVRVYFTLRSSAHPIVRLGWTFDFHRCRPIRDGYGRSLGSALAQTFKESLAVISFYTLQPTNSSLAATPTFFIETLLRFQRSPGDCRDSTPALPAFPRPKYHNLQDFQHLFQLPNHFLHTTAATTKPCLHRLTADEVAAMDVVEVAQTFTSATRLMAISPCLTYDLSNHAGVAVEVSKAATSTRSARLTTKATRP